MEKYNIGLCFKIYVHNDTTIERYNIIKTFFQSLNLLINNYNNLIIFGIIDCIVTDRLNNILKELSSDINIIYLNKNTGISFATNIGIEYLLNNNCDYIFCCDDDIIIKDANVLTLYINALILNEIDHLGYYPLHIYNIDNIKCNNLIKICNTGGYPVGYSGCFYCFTKKCIYNEGYLPIMDGKYGYEHQIFTKTITNCQYDIIDSNKYITLNIDSIKFTSGQNIINKIIDDKLIKFINNNYWKDKLNNFIYN